MKDRIYTKEYHESIGSPEQLNQYIGKEYISYSYLSSFLQRRDDWITTYLFDQRLENIWANYGKAVGTFFETKGKEVDEILTEDTVALLKSHLFLDDYEFEKPIGFIIDKYLLIGFIDVYRKDVLIDIKTGSKDSISKYEEDSYMQTRLYCYGLESMGITPPNKVGVMAFLRKGNNTSKHPLRLEGGPEFIETPYNKKEVDGYIEEVLLPAINEIDDYKKLFKELLIIV